MYPLMTGEEVRNLEDRLFESNSITPESLLDHVTDQMFAQLKPQLRQDKPITILAGPGNNGADAIKIARLILAEHPKASLKVIFVECATVSALHKKKSGELAAQLKKVNGGNYQEYYFDEATPIAKFITLLENEFRNERLIIDGIFGAGLSRPLSVHIQKIIEFFNSQSATRVAIDIPTGLDSLEGTVNPIAFEADITLTCYKPKPGFFVNEGPLHTGKIKVIKFPGIETQVKPSSTKFVFAKKDLIKYFPRRSPVGNKSTNGKLLVLAGSEGMEGAARLASLAAARLGVGYVTVSSPSETLRSFLPPDFLWKQWDENLDFHGYDTILYGPGLGRSAETLGIFKKLLKHPNVICDADGLFSLALQVTKLPPSWILTPHAGELSRLMRLPASEIEANRWQIGYEAAEKFGCTILLKGFRTTVSWTSKKSGKIHQAVITTGNSALAKAGTGDVLAGFIAALTAQGLPSWKAALTAASYHGNLADQWVKEGKGNWSLMASDLLKSNRKNSL
ncbi:MAG: NAD(P)H-hydrate dehydratase [Bdellovibrionota bacterium]